MTHEQTLGLGFLVMAGLLFLLYMALGDGDNR